MRHKSLSFGFILNFIKTLLNLAFPIVTFAYASKILGTEGIGIASYTDSIIKYFILFGGSGIVFYGIKEIAKVRADKEELIKTTKEIFFINLLFSVAAYLLLFIFIKMPVGNQYSKLLLIQGSLILFNALGMEWLYNGLEEFSYITIRTLVFQIIAIIALVVFVQEEGDYTAYIIVNVFALAGPQIMNFICARKHVKQSKNKVKIQLKKHFMSMKYILGANVAISIYLHIDKTMIGILVGTNAVGLYAAANNIARAVAGLLTCITNVALPRISYYLQDGKKEDAFHLIEDLGNIIVMITVPMAIGLACISKVAIIVVCGEEFMSAGLALIILSVTIIFSVYNNFWVWQIFIPLNYEKKVFLGTLISAVINFLLNVILIPTYGIVGAAVATLFAEMVMTVLCIVWGKNVVKLKSMMLRYPQYIIGGMGVFAICAVMDVFVLPEMISTIIKISISIIFYFWFLYKIKNEYFRKILAKLANLVEGRK